ncbi:MAG: NAD(P)-dependent alcohol dehydrogenase [Acidobacteria bacterium]|nr:NAD(P)-dependent alcohol dehydrogenase [Acidobacteriota bacterium]
MSTTNFRAYGALDKSAPLAPLTIERRDPTSRDVELDVLYCGVCHSDLHTVRSEWTGTHYPCVPGHEIVGRVRRVGNGVTRFVPGQLCAVGVMVDSCRTCRSCQDRLEQYCTGDPTFTYNSPDAHLPGQYTYGGYSRALVVDEHFCFRLSDVLDPAAAAPLLCAGITVYSPLKHWGATAGTTVGIVGLGGLGHMGVKFSHALGAHTVLFTTSRGKLDDGKRLGADDAVLSTDAVALDARKESFDLIIDTVSAAHDLSTYSGLLKRDGVLVLVGLPDVRHPGLDAAALIPKRRSIAGSMIGSVAETQEMLDFCAERRIAADVEVIPMHAINDAYARMLRSDVRYRFVVDLGTL